MTEAGTIVLGPLAIFLIGAIAGAGLGVTTGIRLYYLLLHRPLPRPWRGVPRVWRYLAPGELWRDTVRLTEDLACRWDAQHPVANDWPPGNRPGQPAASMTDRIVTA